MNGRSQAVRLPKEFRFLGTEVEIRREGEAVVLEPVEKREWPEGFFKEIRVGEDFERLEQVLTPDVVANDNIQE